MNENPKVVSFERSPSYVHHRAMVNRRENNALDALELMRSAVERSPENREYRLDLAEMYCEMGCHRQSNQLLLDMLAQQDPPAECFFGLALNRMGMDDLEGARKMLRQYRRIDPRGAHVETADQIVQELNLMEAINRPYSRKVQRAERLSDRASEAMEEGDSVRALILFEQSLAAAPRDGRIRALYAAALSINGELDAAVVEAERAVQGFPPSIQAMCIASRVFSAAGQDARAEELLRGAMAAHPTGVDLNVLACACGEQEMYAEAAECARLALQETPYERRLLHIRAVALHRMGEPDARVARFWERILRIDPEDSVAQYYLDVCHQGNLSRITLSCVYEVPDEEARRRMRWLSDKMRGGVEEAGRLWKDDPAFRQTLLWAASQRGGELQHAGAAIIAAIDDPRADSLVRATLFNQDVNERTRMHIACLLHLRGADLKTMFPAEVSGEASDSPDGEQVMKHMFVGERQVVRYAAEVLDSDFGVSALAPLAMMWMAYRQLRGMRFDPMDRSEAISAALVLVFLRQLRRKASAGRMARLFGCSRRMVRFYAARMEAVLKHSEGMTEDEDH